MEVFISRTINSESPFYKLMQPHVRRVYGQSLLRFEAVPSTWAGSAWLFFYSKKAVHYFLAQHRIPRTTRLACIGQGTANALRKRGYTVDFEGNGEPFYTAEAFRAVVGAAEVVFPQAAQSRQSIERILVGQIRASSLIVYRSEALETIPKVEANVLVWTSPRNAQLYFERHNLASWQSVVAIGGSTSGALETLNIRHRVAAAPYPADLVEAVRTSIQTDI